MDIEQKIIKDIERELSRNKPNNHWIKKCTKVLKTWDMNDWIKTGLIEKPQRVFDVLGEDLDLSPSCQHLVRYGGGYLVQVCPFVVNHNEENKFVWDNYGEPISTFNLKEIEEVIWKREFVFSEPYWEIRKKDWEEYLENEGLNSK